MPKIRMKATKPLKYGSNRLSVGDEFDARGNGDARLLVAIGKAVRLPSPMVAALLAPMPEPKPAPSARYRTTKIEPVVSVPEVVESVVVAETEVAAETPVIEQPAEIQETEVKPAKRQYRRRDMKAESEE